MDLSDRDELFWSKVDRRGSDDCWVWLGSRNRQGYGHFWDVDRRVMGLAHRWSHNRFVRDVGPGLIGGRGTVIRHTCDNPPCVNPRHLVAGTQQDNMRDAVDRGRTGDHRGERNGRAKLSPEIVAAIRSAAVGQYGERSRLAREFGISTGHVSKILAGTCWT